MARNKKILKKLLSKMPSALTAEYGIVINMKSLVGRKSGTAEVGTKSTSSGAIGSVVL